MELIESSRPTGRDAIRSGAGMFLPIVEGRSVERQLIALDELFAATESVCLSLPYEVRYEQAIFLVQMLIWSADQAITQGWSRKQIRKYLSNAWRIHGSSRFGNGPDLDCQCGEKLDFYERKLPETTSEERAY